MNLLHDLLFDYTLRNVALGCMILGTVSGMLGSFAVLRRQGLLGDALAHAALPGVCVVFILTGLKTPIVLMIGAALSGWIGMLAINQILKRSRIDSGAALGTILTVFFGFGVVLLTVIQKSYAGKQAGLDKFLFGQAAGLVAEQVLTMAILSVIALSVVLLLFKEFKVISFDPEFAQSISIPTHAVANLLSALLLVAIVVGLNTVGVVLMSAMLVGPAAAARQWTNSLKTMLFIAAAVGTISGLAGALISVLGTKIPTGPVIVIVLSLIVLISVLFGSARGVVWESLRRRRRKFVGGRL
jgi:manganese/zinc/iron transport system permease protein